MTLLVAATLGGSGAPANAARHTRPAPGPDTVVVVVRDGVTNAPLACVGLGARRPRAVGGTFREWGGFVEDSTGTWRLGGVGGGTVVLSVHRDGYLEWSRWFFDDMSRPETLVVRLTPNPFKNHIPTCAEIRRCLREGCMSCEGGEADVARAAQ